MIFLCGPAVLALLDLLFAFVLDFPAALAFAFWGLGLVGTVFFLLNVSLLLNDLSDETIAFYATLP